MKKTRVRLNFWQTSQLVPPILARLLAKKGSVIMTDSEIAAASGLSADDVFVFSHKTTWDGIDARNMRRFLNGCRCDFCDAKQMNRVKQYFRSLSRKGPKTSWKYLRMSPEWKTRFEPLLIRYQLWTRNNVAKT